MKWLLVGATGQIGHALAHAMAQAGHDLSVSVRSGRQLFPDTARVRQQLNPTRKPSSRRCRASTR